MAITSAYKNNTVSSVNGIYFNSNGTPFTSGDVGRLIILTSGSGKLQHRKIVNYNDSNTVTLDHAWDTNPWLDSVDDVAPSSGDAWAMSYLQTSGGFTSESGVTVSGEQITISALELTGDAYVHITNAQVDLASAGMEIGVGAGIIFGWYRYIAGEDAQVADSCHIIDSSNGTSPTENQMGRGTSHGEDFGMLDIYGGSIYVPNQPFWRCYHSDSSDCQNRWIGIQAFGDGSGGLGSRIDGDRSIIISEQVGATTTLGICNPKQAVSRVSMSAIDCNQAGYVWLDVGGGGPSGRMIFPRLNDIAQKVIRCNTDGHSGTNIMEVIAKKSEIDAAANFINASSTPDGTHYFRFGNIINPTFVDTDVTAVTDNIYTALFDEVPTSVDTRTITDGSFAELFVRHTDVQTLSGNRNIDDGTQYAPYNLLVGSYKYRLINQVITVEDTFDAVLTLLDDEDAVSTTEATVAAYTSSSFGTNLDEGIYDYAKYKKITAHLTHPAYGVLIAENTNGVLDFSAQNVVFTYDATGALSLLTISETGDGTVTVNHPLSMTFAGVWTGIKTTGDITFNGDVPDNITLDGDVYLNSEQDLTGVTINGDLHIATGADSTLTFSNTTAHIFNDSASNTLTINATNGSSLTAGDPGTGNGQTDIQAAAPITVTVLDTADVPIEDASIQIIAMETVGTITTGDEIYKGLANASGVISTTINYEGAFDPSGLDIKVKARQGSVAPYKVPASTLGVISSTGFAATITMQPDE